MSQSILVTGATGTFGRAFIRRALHTRPGEWPRWSRVIAFSRDEQKQAALLDEFGHDGPRLFLGDVRDTDRLTMAMRGVGTVVHAAALKRVDVGAYTPSEMVATNVLGTMNVVNAAILAGVERVVVLSSDKCVSATNIYGASKYLAECYAVQSNAYGAGRTRIAAVRYGNILGSRGSVVGIWQQQLARGVPLTITDLSMTRFIMTIEQAVDLVLHALRQMNGGEVFLPFLSAALIGDLADAVAIHMLGKGGYHYPVTVQGVRPGGEKLHESLLNDEEQTRTWVDGYGLVIGPSHHEWTRQEAWGEARLGAMTYRSDLAPQLTQAELLAMLERTETCRK